MTDPDDDDDDDNNISHHDDHASCSDGGGEIRYSEHIEAACEAANARRARAGLLVPDNEEKVRKRRISNLQSVRQSRKRKKERVEQIQQEANRLTQANLALKQENEQLEGILKQVEWVINTRKMAPRLSFIGTACSGSSATSNHPFQGSMPSSNLIQSFTTGITPVLPLSQGGGGGECSVPSVWRTMPPCFQGAESSATFPISNFGDSVVTSASLHGSNSGGRSSQQEGPMRSMPAFQEQQHLQQHVLELPATANPRDDLSVQQKQHPTSIGGGVELVGRFCGSSSRHPTFTAFQDNGTPTIHDINNKSTVGTGSSDASLTCGGGENPASFSPLNVFSMMSTMKNSTPLATNTSTFQSQGRPVMMSCSLNGTTDTPRHSLMQPTPYKAETTQLSTVCAASVVHQNQLSTPNHFSTSTEQVVATQRHSSSQVQDQIRQGTMEPLRNCLHPSYYFGSAPANTIKLRQHLFQENPTPTIASTSQPSKMMLSTSSPRMASHTSSCSSSLADALLHNGAAASRQCLHPSFYFGPMASNALQLRPVPDASTKQISGVVNTLLPKEISFNQSLADQDGIESDDETMTAAVATTSTTTISRQCRHPSFYFGSMASSSADGAKLRQELSEQQMVTKSSPMSMMMMMRTLGADNGNLALSLSQNLRMDPCCDNNNDDDDGESSSFSSFDEEVNMVTL